MTGHQMGAREEWLAGLARDYRDASDDAAADYDPADTYEPEDDDAATSWPPAAETGVHLVRPSAPRGSLHGQGGDEDVAGAAGVPDRRDHRLPLREADARRPLSPSEVRIIKQKAIFNGPISRIEVRRLCATIEQLRLRP